MTVAPDSGRRSVGCTWQMLSSSFQLGLEELREAQERAEEAVVSKEARVTEKVVIR